MSASTVAVTERSCTPRFVATVATPAVRQPASAASTISGGVAPLSSEAKISGWSASIVNGWRCVLLGAEPEEVGDRSCGCGCR